MRQQLRPFYTPEEYARVYNETYNHTYWSDHIERVAKTIDVLDRFAAMTMSESIADLSCGDGAIVWGSQHPWTKIIVGDYTTTGPIEEEIHNVDHVDMWLLSETIEHMEDPDTLLRQIRVRANHMVLTTPYGEDNNYNPQHYWGWDVDGMGNMLHEAGWVNNNVQLFTPRTNPYYTFQIWECM